MPDFPAGTVFLLPVEPSAIQRLKEAGTGVEGCSWIYLGKSVPGSARVQQQLGKKYRRIFIGDMLQKAAQDARQEYIDYIGRLFSDSKSPIWFLSSLSEKNPYISRFLVHYAYVRAAGELVAGHHGDLAIVCEDAAVISCLAKALSGSQDQYRLRILSSPHGTILHEGRNFLKKAGRKCWFVFRFSLRILCSRFYRLVKRRPVPPSRENLKWVVLHSWTDSRSFPAPGSFSSSYFGDLGDSLCEKYPSVLYLSDVLPSYWYPRAVCNLLRSGKNAALMEEFISVKDLFLALKTASEDIQIPLEIPTFKGLDMSDIVHNELEQDRSDTRTERTFLCSCVGRRLCRSFDMGLFLYAFENHIWEKMFCEAIRKTGCRATLAGYAGVVINPMYTCYSLSEYEKQHTPLPDVIFVSGEQGRSVLNRSGFDNSMIHVGGAIRYNDLLEKKKAADHAAGTTVLLALTGEINASLEMVSKTIEAFSACPEIRVLIKCHPTIPYAAFSSHLPQLPDTFSVTTLPIKELLPEAGLVLYTESTVCVEAVAQGIPVLHVRSDHSIDINIFEGNPAIPSCSDPRDIRGAALAMLRGTGAVPSRELITDLFSTADRNALAMVLLSLIRQ